VFFLLLGKLWWVVISTLIDTLTDTLTIVNMFFANVWHTGRVSFTKLPEVCCGPGSAPTLAEPDAVELASLLKAVADPVRLRLLNIISQSGEACACDLPALLDRSQPTISHHLKILVEAGLLDREQRGKWAWFTVQGQRLRALGDALTPDGLLPGEAGAPDATGGCC
jgi:ArsR family transcriptional regulator